MKVIKRVRNYLYLDFYKSAVGLSWLIRVFHNNTNSRILFFLFCNFRAQLEHFVQSKSTSIINWMLFRVFETTCISIFMKVQLICPALFTFFVTVLTHEFSFFSLHNFRAQFEHFGQRKSTSIINWKLFRGVRNYLHLDFHEGTVDSSGVIRVFCSTSNMRNFVFPLWSN